MQVYRKIAEKMVEIYDFDWKGNSRMQEACICSVEGLLANVLDGIIVFLFAFIMGVFKEMLVFFVNFGLMRLYAGGAHAKNYVKCVITYISIMYISILIARQCTLLNEFCTMIVSLVGVSLSGWINIKYAAKQKFVGHKRNIYRKKAFSIYTIISCVMTLGYISFLYTSNQFLQEMVLLQGFALLAQSGALLLENKKCVNIGKEAILLE